MNNNDNIDEWEFIQCFDLWLLRVAWGCLGVGFFYHDTHPRYYVHTTGSTALCNVAFAYSDLVVHVPEHGRESSRATTI